MTDNNNNTVYARGNHMHVYMVDNLYVWVVSVEKVLSDFTQSCGHITHHYGTIVNPKGEYRERAMMPLDEFMQKYGISKVEQLDWVYKGIGERSLQHSMNRNNHDYYANHVYNGCHYTYPAYRWITKEHEKFDELMSKRKEREVA